MMVRGTVVALLESGGIARNVAVYRNHGFGEVWMTVLERYRGSTNHFDVVRRIG